MKNVESFICSDISLESWKLNIWFLTFKTNLMYFHEKSTPPYKNSFATIFSPISRGLKLLLSYCNKRVYESFNADASKQGALNSTAVKDKCKTQFFSRPAKRLQRILVNELSVFVKYSPHLSVV